MENKLQHTCATTREFALQLLEHITNNFSEERIIGRGGYGVVYKGVLEDGQEIAVKKLHHMPGLDDKQFRNEFNNFMRAQHQNVVRLVGYCYDIGHQRIKHNGEYIFALVEERLLCFEYLQGGSLDKHVSDESCRLDWPSCYKIIKGVCEGLNYLHNGSKDPMYHLDLKPANILLDKDMTPKIGDFGLSRLFPSAHTYITTKIVGTRGYMPPEYIDRYQITPKFDVFSLGVIIIQIMAGRVGYSKCADIPSQEFIKLVHENWRKKMQPTMLSHTSQGVKTCIEIALRCVETDRVKRPTVAEIVNELNKIDTTIVDELNEFDDTKSSPIAQWRSLERKLGGLMHKVSDLRSKQAFNQYASSGGRLLPLPETLSAKPLRGHVYSHYLRRRNLRKKWVRWLLLLLLSVVGWSITCFWFFLSQNFMQVEVRRKSLASMCDQYASMVQDQFSVSMYYLNSLAILVSTFHHSQNPSAINQTTSAWYTKRTAFERPLTSGLAYAVRVTHVEREQGWSTTKMWSSKNKSPGRWDAAAAEIRQPAEEYAPVIFAQDSNALVISFDILSGDSVVMANEFYSRSLRGEIDGATLEDSQNFSSIGEQPSQIEEPSVYLRPKNKRSKTEQEDNLLVQAWLNTSLNAATSNEQTHDSYWAMIHHYFHNNKQFVSVHNQNSLSNHWGTIQGGCYDQIQNRRQSGMTAQDKIVQVYTLYQVEDTKGRSFRLLHCWRVLEHHPNWTSRLSQRKQKTASNASPTTSSLGMTSNDDEVEASTPKHEPLRRPTSKKAKKKRVRRDKSFVSSDSSLVMLVLDKVWSKKIEREDKKEAKKEAWYERALAMEEKMMALEESKQAIEKNKIALEQQKLDFQRRSDDERIMSMNISAMTEPQQQYYISLQCEIIARRYSTLG